MYPVNTSINYKWYEGFSNKVITLKWTRLYKQYSIKQQIVKAKWETHWKSVRENLTYKCRNAFVSIILLDN